MPTSKNKSSAQTLSMRIVVVEPPPSILWALQVGRDDLVKPTSTTKSKVSFDFKVDVVEDDSDAGFRLRGPVVQGRPGERFIYLCIGAYAGQFGALAGWRAKVRLDGITRKLVEAAKSKPSTILEVQFAGTSPKGGPACATVPLLGDGWHVA